MVLTATETARPGGANHLPASTSSGNGAGTLTATNAMTYDSAGNLITVDGPLAGTAERFRYATMRLGVRSERSPRTRTERSLCRTARCAPPTAPTARSAGPRPGSSTASPTPIGRQ